jgi:hypothetical protein
MPRVWIDELRILKGSAAWIDNFSVREVPYTPVGVDAAALLAFAGTITTADVVGALACTEAADRLSLGGIRSSIDVLPVTRAGRVPMVPVTTAVRTRAPVSSGRRSEPVAVHAERSRLMGVRAERARPRAVRSVGNLSVSI